MPPEMWLPLLVMARFPLLRSQCVVANALEVLRREGKTRWVNELFAVPAASQSTSKPNAMYFSSLANFYIWTGMEVMSGLRTHQPFWF